MNSYGNFPSCVHCSPPSPWHRAGHTSALIIPAIQTGKKGLKCGWWHLASISHSAGTETFQNPHCEVAEQPQRAEPPPVKPTVTRQPAWPSPGLCGAFGASRSSGVCTGTELLCSSSWQSRERRRILHTALERRRKGGGWSQLKCEHDSSPSVPAGATPGPPLPGEMSHW